MNANLESYQFTYHFKLPFEKMWLIIRDISVYSLITSIENYHPINTKGIENYIVGSEFIGIILGKFPYNGKVLKVIEIPGYKKIKYCIQLQNGGYLILKIEVLKVTEDNTAIAIITVKINQIFKENIEIFNEKTFNENFKKIEKEIQKSLIDIIQYESGIIRGSMQDIWDFSTNPNNLKKIAPLIELDGDEEFIQPNIGDNLIIYYDNHSKKIYIKVIVLDKKENWNKWIYIIQILGGEPKIPMQKILLELTKINQSECQLLLLNTFDEPISNEIIQKICEQKKYVIKSIKDYLENYKI